MMRSVQVTLDSWTNDGCTATDATPPTGNYVTPFKVSTICLLICSYSDFLLFLHPESIILVDPHPKMPGTGRLIVKVKAIE